MSHTLQTIIISTTSYLAAPTITLAKRRGGGDVGATAAEASDSSPGSQWLNTSALVISLLALIATIGQLLQQYVATADGYRRCGSSVMGPWGRKTRLRWRWREFRFECLYCVPYIEYNLPIKTQDGTKETLEFCAEPKPTTFNPNPPKKDKDWNAELVGWVHLLHNLGLHEQHVRKTTVPLNGRDKKPMAYHDWMRYARVEIASRSWDFVPEDVLRPLAITTLGSLAATTRRLGMTWKQFEPNIGTLQAEGNYQVITSTVIRGMGVVIHYLRDAAIDNDPLGQMELRRTSPLAQADELLYGRIGHLGIFNMRHGLPHLVLHVGNMTDVSATLPILYSNPDHADAVVTALRIQNEAGNKNWMEPANDIVPFLSPYLGIAPESRPIIPWPNTCARRMTHTAFKPFEDQLIAHVDRRGAAASSTSRALLGYYQGLSARSASATTQRDDNQFTWETPKQTFKSDVWVPDSFDVRAVYGVFTECETMLDASPVVRAGKYHVLVAQHVLTSTHIDPTVADAEKMRRMFAALPEIARAVRAEWDGEGEVLEGVTELTSQSPQTQSPQPAVEVKAKTEWITRPTEMQVEDAWLGMMLRGMCWQRLHVVQPGMPLPIEYSMSMLPVFIA